MIRCFSNTFTALISAPFVIISRWRIVMPGLEMAGCGVRVQVDFDVADVAIHEADHVSGVIKPILFRHQFLRLMPRVWGKHWLFRDENCFCGIFYRGQFAAGNARKPVRKWVILADVSCVEHITRIIVCRQQMAGFRGRAADVFGQTKCVGWAGKKCVLRR